MRSDEGIYRSDKGFAPINKDEIEERVAETVESPEPKMNRAQRRHYERIQKEVNVRLASYIRNYFRYIGQERDAAKQANKLREMTTSWTRWVDLMKLPMLASLFPDEVNRTLTTLTADTHATEQLPEQPAGDTDTVRQLSDRDASEVRGVPQAESTDLRNVQEDSEPSDTERSQEPERGVHLQRDPLGDSGDSGSN